MAKKFDFLSPGIELREIDQSFIPSERDAEGPIIIGRTRKGPANKPVKVRNLDDFISVFGVPVPGGTGDTGDVWREGNTVGPTYAAYAAQAWLASEESPVTMVRVAGEQHPNATAGYAGWKLDNTPSPTISSNGAAYGLFIVNSGSTHFGTGALGAVLYANSGYITLTGSTHISSSGGSQVINEAGTFVKSVGANRAFKLNIYDGDGNIKESPVVNFSRNSSKYIRNVLNTNPQLTNSAIIDSNDLKTYWLGETFNRNIEDTVTNTSAGTVYGILLPLASGSANKNWSDRQESATESKSGWVISQQATNQVKLFRFKSISVGDDLQKNYMIAVEDIKEPSNSNVESYGTFSISVMDRAGLRVEKYNNLNLNPASPNYIAKRIGDQYMTWDHTNRRFRTYGDFPNVSDLIYVDMNQNIADGGGAGILPAGFHGPVRPKGFTLAHGHNAANAFGDGAPQGTKAAIVITVAGGELVENDVFTVTLAGDDYRVTVGSTSVTSVTSFTDNGVAASPRYTAIIKAETDDGGAPTGDDLQELFNSVDGYTATDNNSGVVTITADKAGAFFNISYAESTDANSRISAATPTAGTGSDGFLGAFVKGNNTVPKQGGTSTVFAAGPIAFTASFNFPKIALRGDGTEGGASDPYRVYYGIRPKIDNTSNTNDPDYVDYLRGLPAGIDSHQPANVHFEHSFVFSLDDLVVNSDENTVTYTSGSYSSTENGATVSYTSPNNTTSNQNGSFGDLLDLNVRQFLMPMWGGTEGVDITEKEPFRNTDSIIGTTVSETTNYVQYSLFKAIDSVKDPEVVPANLILCPGISAPLITNKLIDTAESRKDVLALIDIENDYIPSAESKDTAANRLGSVTSAVSTLRDRNLNSSYACCFYPFVQISDNLNGGQFVWIPPSVAGLGAMARSQAQSDVWFAPAGFNRGGLGSLGGSRGPGVIQARQRLDSSERDKLYEVNINPIATFPAEGVVIFGQKTLQAGQSALDRINVRRLLLFLKNRVGAVARNLLFDQNVDSTWARFKSQVTPVLANVQARFGLTDYKLILDETTTTPDLIDRNIMYAKIYIKPARAIEYIVVDFVITRTGAEFV